MSRGQSRHRAFRFGVFELDLESQELRKRGVRIKLTPQPLQILGMLVQHQGEVLTREELRRSIWPDEPYGDHDHSLNKAVNRIREALSDPPGAPRYLETVPRVGYRFLFPAEPLEEPGGNVKLPSEPPVPQRQGLTRSRPWLISIAVLFAAALLIGVVSRPVKHSAKPLPTLVPLPVTGYAGTERRPSFSPDGRAIAFSWDGESDGREGIYVCEIGTGRRRELAGGPFVQSSPAWSPDGQQIAFLRQSPGSGFQVMIVNVDGTGQYALGTTQIYSQLAWTQDSTRLVLAGRDESNRNSALYVLSLKDRTKRQLTYPSTLSGDSAPAISPDGRLLAFARYTSPDWNDIFVLRITAELKPIGTPRRITNFRRRIESIAWTSDSRELVYSAGGVTGEQKFLYRVPVTGPGEPRDLAAVRMQGTHPAVSADGKRLAYVRPNIQQTAIWGLRLIEEERPVLPPTRLIASSSRDFYADISPDGRRVAFRSSRSGSPEIWISDINRSNLRQLTKFGENGATAPKWSPDGRSIVMECRVHGQSDIYTVDPDTGALHRITYDSGRDILPSWSRDGNYIYFSSTRKGRPSIWKIPRHGGVPLQVTTEPGLYALESSDARYLYYTDSGNPTKLHRMPASGGEPAEIARNLRRLSSFAVAQNGLYYFAIREPSRQTSLYFYDFATQSETLLLALDKPVHHGLSLSKDGHMLFFAQEEHSESDLMLLQNFH